jgi:hypothetical protein
LRIYTMIWGLQRYDSLRRRIKVMDLRNSTMTTKTVEVGVIMSLSQ